MVDNDNTTLQKIMAEGKKEFLEKGFKDASLRNIVKHAGVTTGAFYGYYPDKKALFEALVLPAVSDLEKLFLDVHRGFDALPNSVKQNIVFDYSIPYLNELISFIYEHFNEFKLLVTCAEGTAYADFINDLVEMEVASTISFIHATGNDALLAGRVTMELMHIISSAYFTAIFEIVVHNMPREAADSYVENLNQFFTAGWKTILNL